MTESQPETANASPLGSESLKNQRGGIFSSWKFKARLIISLVVVTLISLFLLIFFWAHLVAGLGIKFWSNSAGATPIECMIQDSNNDGYVSCSAMLNSEIVPLECGGSIFNIGCRVNYGAAAAPQVRPSTDPNVRSR